MNDILVGIITYNPQVELLIRVLEAIWHQNSNIYIVDNASDNLDIWNQKIEKVYPSIQIEKNPYNKGIAKALNQIFKYAYENNYQWVLTLDQDSISPPNLVNELYRYVHIKKVAVIGAVIEDRNKHDQIQLQEKYREVDNCITSGSLNNVLAWRAIGGFDDWMFIDGVDFDYCHRLRAAEYKVILNCNVKLNHEIGQIQIRRFLLWPVIVRNHSAQRKYYIARNIVYLDKKEHEGRIRLKPLLRVIKQFFLVLFYEKEKSSKLKNILAGLSDGLRYKV